MSIALTSARTASTTTTGSPAVSGVRSAASVAPSAHPEAVAESRLGTAVVLDLSGLGATISDPDADLPVDSADLPRLARHAHAARAAGITEVALSPAFHLRSDAPWRTDSRKDATRTGERLTDAGVDVLLPGAPADDDVHVSAGITATAARGVVAARGTTARRTGGRADAGSRARTAGATPVTGTRVRVAAYVDSVAEAEAAGRLGGTVIVRAIHHARVTEFVAAVRRGADATGTDVRVLVEVHIAIAETRERALGRAELVADIAAVEKRDLPWAGSAASIGSVEEVLAEARSFGALGDGLLLVPISVPADLTAILRDLV